MFFKINYPLSPKIIIQRKKNRKNRLLSWMVETSIKKHGYEIQYGYEIQIGSQFQDLHELIQIIYFLFFKKRKSKIQCLIKKKKKQGSSIKKKY